MKIKQKLNIWFVLHVLFFVVVISSIFWLPWYVLLFIFLILRIQDVILGGCILTKLEYGSYDRRFDAENGKYILPKKILKFIPITVDWIIPGILVIISYFIKQN